jgi:hypothetical protein
MTIAEVRTDSVATQKPPKFRIDFEGAISDWAEDTITPPQLREILALPADVPIEEVDLLENTRRIVPEDEAVKLRSKMLFLFPLIICPIFVQPYNEVFGAR